MADPADDSYLGGIDVRLDGESGAEVGYAVAPWARGRGVGSHALALACRWAFDVARVEVVLWLAYAGNEASRRTARRVGFRVPESVVRRGLAQRGHRRDAWVGDLLPEDLRDLS
jgi:RimJ/RimL family protein N-acetyltransferase